MNQPLPNQTATIASGAALSGAIDLGGADDFAIVMPSAWTTANLSFQGSDSLTGTYADLYTDGGNEVVVSAAASRVISLANVRQFLGGVRFLKIRSGTTGTPVNQAAERSLTILLKG